jgi:hypothetical protein
MEKNELRNTVLIASIASVVLIMIIVGVRTCNKPVTNPAIKMLQDINDSLYQIIEINNSKTDTLFMKIDSLNVKGDTIIQQQEITNQYYRNETFNILNSDNAAASKQFRTTLKKSDSLLKAGFYTRTYNLRSTTFQSQLQ